MSKLLIENVAIALNLNPLHLNDLELRKLCILIDWTLTLATYQPGRSHTPLLSANIDLYQDLTAILVAAIREDNFPELDTLKPDTEKMDAMFKRLGRLLGFEESIIEDIDTGFISDYEMKLAANGLVYTDYLTYKRNLIREEQTALATMNDEFMKRFSWINQQAYFQFDQEKYCIRIMGLSTDALSATTPSEQIDFIVSALHQLTQFRSIYKRSIAEESLLMLCDQLKRLLGDCPPFKHIDKNLTEIIEQARNLTIIDQVRQILADYIMRFPQLRGWKAFVTEPLPKPVNRVILMGYQDITDEEIIRVVSMMYKKHPHENIVITFNAADVKKVTTPFTLQVIGHGTTDGAFSFTSNLGPFRGDALITGQQVGELVNACPNITHLRISSCFSGTLASAANLCGLYEKTREGNPSTKEARRTLTFIADSNLTTQNSPFHNKTAAISCWNAIEKVGREISMTVSPGIIEPDEEIGHMVWKPAPTDSKAEIGVKEIRITTNGGPKCLTLWELKRQSTNQVTSLSKQLEQTKLTTPVSKGNSSIRVYI